MSTSDRSGSSPIGGIGAGAEPAATMLGAADGLVSILASGNTLGPADGAASLDSEASSDQRAPSPPPLNPLPKPLDIAWSHVIRFMRTAARLSNEASDDIHEARRAIGIAKTKAEFGDAGGALQALEACLQDFHEISIKLEAVRCCVCTATIMTPSAVERLRPLSAALVSWAQDKVVGEVALMEDLCREGHRLFVAGCSATISAVDLLHIACQNRPTSSRRCKWISAAADQLNLAVHNLLETRAQTCRLCLKSVKIEIMCFHAAAKEAGMRRQPAGVWEGWEEAVAFASVRGRRRRVLEGEAPASGMLKFGPITTAMVETSTMAVIGQSC
ncbi:hypothetical protein E2562_012658 [Oryza meyeriana var. granulata]|uniref:Uncharacterized protein n=1 Tax=Oryza meyeriana var. granulata TaxID=110450 RepID=A0A6G1CFP5_9ORYZ|nr:hypothetical protein E2562_012658 [Oryza meyeriana var. granulata]